MRFFLGILAFSLFMACLSPVAVFAKSDKDQGESVFADTMSGCKHRAITFMMAHDKYKEGIPAEQVAGKMPRMLPEIQKMYKVFQEKGSDRAALQGIEDFVSCVKSAKKTKRDDSDYARQREKSCDNITSMLTETLQGIKNRKKPETIISRYAGKKTGFEGTPYENNDAAVAHMVNGIYGIAQEKSFGNAIQAVQLAVMGCYTGR